MNKGKRAGQNERRTRETCIRASICIDGQGGGDIETGVGFLDHMLQLLAKHARFDINIGAEGDLEVDDHHTTEDVGIVLGGAFKEALGDKSGINRFSDVSVPMQDSLASVALDICGRPYLAYGVEFPTEKVGAFDTDLVEEFLHAFVTHSGITMHVHESGGVNSHHIAEAVFKSLARALRHAAAKDPRSGNEVPSTKGTLG